MDQRLVKDLEETIEKAIADALRIELADALPRVPDRHTLHLMAKAAVTVYEATCLDKSRR